MGTVGGVMAAAGGAGKAATAAAVAATATASSERIWTQVLVRILSDPARTVKTSQLCFASRHMHYLRPCCPISLVG